MANGVKYCRKCGNKLSETDKFCRKCGTEVIGIVSSDAAGKEATAGKEASAAGQDRLGSGKSPKKKKKGGKRFVAVLLVAALLFTAFVKPGFLRKGDGTGDDDENYGSEYYAGHEQEEYSGWEYGNGTAEDAHTEEEDVPAPDRISYIPDLEAIAAIEPETASVSPADHVKDVAGIHFDFDTWNLEGDDTLEVRDAGTVEADDVSIRLLDFSLASGQHEFLTSVEVVIPKEPGEENATVEWFDPDENKWRPVAYHESEDGQNFILHTDHFSVKGIVSSNTDEGQKSASQLANQYLSVTDGSKNFFSVKKTDKNGKKYPALSEPVQYERADAIRLMYSERPEITSILRSNDINAEAIAQTDDQASLAKFSEMLGYSDAENSVFGIRDKIIDKIVGGSATTKVVGGYLWFWQALNTVENVTRELEKNDTAYPIITKNLPSIIGVVAGGIGALASAGIISSSGFVVVPATVVGLLCMAWPGLDFIADEKPTNFREEAYFYYLDNSSYLDNSMKFSNTPTGDKCVQLKMDGTGWEEAFKRILKKDKDDSAALEKDISKLYDDYIKRFYDMPADARYSFVKNNYEEGDITGLFYGFYCEGYADEEDFQTEKSYAMKHAKQILVEHTKVYLFKVIRDQLDRWEEIASEEMRDKVVPFLNQKLTFKVRDSGLDSGQHFCDSVYAQNANYFVPAVFDETIPFSFPKEMEEMYDPAKIPMLFVDMHPEFIPANEDWSDYSAYHFLPHAVQNDDVIFECTRYFYTAMGSPVKMLFRGDGTPDNPEKTVEFTVPEREHLEKITVYIDLLRDAAPQEEKNYSGRYIPSMDISEYDYYVDKCNNASLGTAGIAEYLFNYALGELSINVGDNGSVTGSASRNFSFNYLEKYPVSGSVELKVSGKGDFGENPNVPLTFDGSLSFYMPNYEKDFVASLTGTGTINEYDKSHGLDYYGADCEWIITASDWHEVTMSEVEYITWKSEK